VDFHISRRRLSPQRAKIFLAVIRLGRGERFVLDGDWFVSVRSADEVQHFPLFVPARGQVGEAGNTDAARKRSVDPRLPRCRAPEMLETWSYVPTVCCDLRG
jgi:hypothetical protein